MAKKVADLNGDHIKDVALIIESTSPWPTLVADGDRQVPNTENFHRWFLLLKGQQKGYSLWAEDSQLLGSDAKGEQPHDDEHPFIVASSKQLELGIQFLRGHESAVFKLNRQRQWQLSQKVMTGVLADEFIERAIHFDKGVVKDQTSTLNASTATRKLPQVKGKFALIRPLILGKDCLEDIENQYIQPIASLSEQTWLR
ncbi:hypothetical protein LIN78_04540 [Leeia sp. TBRC 13508]|uniref:Uncharacterized protein n=1 Tax=Leeia speluncae TaxID=2884804 RepID=A0ABS8D3V6_9NEIS|nr:hypothetical protein [Leeia speluncae]MCB6182817.1 hypothetical protein [Leeia speluncae]